MTFDLFISHSRRDDLDGRITKLIERLNREFEKIHGRELKVFFDTAEVRGWDEWRARSLPALRESRLFLAFLSTSYLESDHCEWDLNEYFKREIARGLAGDGVIVVDAIDWTQRRDGVSNYSFECRFEEIRRRGSFDFRRELEPLHQVASHSSRLIRLIERSEHSPGNINPFNPHFTGRSSELERIRESLARERLCVLSGPIGIGKTAIAVEYAHAFAGEYGGGRWQVSCQGRSPSSVFNSPELYELRSRAFARDKRCLLVLDDVTEPNILLPTELLAASPADWLHVIAATRLGERHFSPGERDRSFLTVQGLPEAEAIQLIESFQLRPGIGITDPRKIAQRIARLVDGFPLAIEAAAASAMYSPHLRLEDFIDPLWKAKYQARSVMALLNQIVSLLSDVEIKALRFAPQLDDPFELSLIRRELARDFIGIRRDDERPGYPSAWQSLMNHLFSLRLWQPTNEVDANGELRTARMHPLLRLGTQQIKGERASINIGLFGSLVHPGTVGLPPAGLTPPRTGLGPPGSLSPPAIASRDEDVESEMPGGSLGSSRDPAVIVVTGDRITGKKIQIPQLLDDNVMFTVYRRKTIAPNKWYQLLAFAHLSERRPDAPPEEPDPIVEVEHQAQAVLGAAIASFKESTEDSSQAIPISGELMFRPSVPGVEFNPPGRTFKWEEPVHREEFKMRATKELKGQVARGCLRVFLGPIIVAEVNLAFKVDSNAGGADIVLDFKDQALPFRKVFASYSHKDTAIVEHIEKLVRDAHLGLEYLRDVTKLRSGDVWDPSLLKMIDTADLFQLFWSTNSMCSDYVKREYEHAIARQQPGFVRPVYWEKPFPERPEEGLPPEALKRLHFEELNLINVTPVSKLPTVSPVTEPRLIGINDYQESESYVLPDLEIAKLQLEIEQLQLRSQAEDARRRAEERAFRERPSGARFAQRDRREKYGRNTGSYYSPVLNLQVYKPERSQDHSSPAHTSALVTVVSLITTLLFLVLKFFGVVHSVIPVFLCSIIFVISLIVFIIRFIRD